MSLIPLVTCLILFCEVAGATGQCVPGGDLRLVETREYVTGSPRPFLSAEKQACQARFYELREVSPAADEWPVRFEVARAPRPDDGERRSPPAVELAEGPE